MDYIHKYDIVDVEMKNGRIFRPQTNRIIGEGDIKADVFGVRLFRDGEQITLTGATVTGYFVRADGSTVVLTGAVNESNIAYVRLAEACYAIEGNFSLSVKVTGTDPNSQTITGTMRIVDGTVVSTTTGTIVDPGTLVADIDDLIAEIHGATEELEDVVASLPADYSDIWESFAPAFSADASYREGQFVTYDGAVWRFSTDHSGAWNADHARQTDMGANLYDNFTPIWQFLKYFAYHGGRTDITTTGTTRKYWNCSTDTAVLTDIANDDFGRSTRLRFRRGRSTPVTVKSATRTLPGHVWLRTTTTRSSRPPATSTDRHRASATRSSSRPAARSCCCPLPAFPTRRYPG